MEMSDPIGNVTDHKELHTDRVRKEDEKGRERKMRRGRW